MAVPGHMIGWQGVVHGGILSTLLDEVMSWGAIFLTRRFILTKTMTVNYHKPVFAGDKLRVESSIENRNSERECVMNGRIINSNILGNLLSHDNPFSAKIGDLKAFWSDLKDFERLFFCDEIKCNTPVSFKNYDTVKKEIRCSCGKLVYDWKT